MVSQSDGDSNPQSLISLCVVGRVIDCVIGPEQASMCCVRPCLGAMSLVQCRRALWPCVGSRACRLDQLAEPGATAGFSARGRLQANIEDLVSAAIGGMERSALHMHWDLTVDYIRIKAASETAMSDGSGTL